jgi:hypothetical protein
MLTLLHTLLKVLYIDNINIVWSYLPSPGLNKVGKTENQWSQQVSMAFAPKGCIGAGAFGGSVKKTIITSKNNNQCKLLYLNTDIR